ncbi:MAG: A/G-specific adenine glycosylase [Bacteroidales bacterium]
MDFTEQLLLWYKEKGRSLPWRENRDVYLTWISEIILQQTRMDQGLAYFNRFVEAFPDLHALANASEDQVLRLWQGLGYYTRARNLHEAAKYIHDHMEGSFPGSSKEWMKMKGVGPYTAAAIASIAFDEPVPAIDGNVYRILARIFAIREPIDTQAGKKTFQEVAEQLMPVRHPGDFNQAMMDFGSLVCRPANPLCNECFYFYNCLARLQNAVAEYPVKRPKKPARNRYFNYFFFFQHLTGEEVAFFVKKRASRDIWKNMYELPLLETVQELEESDMLKDWWWAKHFDIQQQLVFYAEPATVKHQLTHQTIYARLYQVRVDKVMAALLSKRYVKVNKEAFEGMAKPRLIERLLKKVV